MPLRDHFCYGNHEWLRPWVPAAGIGVKGFAEGSAVGCDRKRGGEGALRLWPVLEGSGAFCQGGKDFCQGGM